MSGGSRRGRAWTVVEAKALCVACRNASEMGGTDEKELEARVRANFKEWLMHMHGGDMRISR